MANKKCDKLDYLCLSAMLKAREARMLTGEKAERMLAAPSVEEAAKLLCDCGYEDMSAMSAKQIEKALGVRQAELLSELEKLSPDKSLVAVFRIKYDYHNAKTVIKANAESETRLDLLSNCGRINAQTLLECCTEDDYRGLPKELEKAMVEAKSILARTANPQLADFVLDKACYAEMLAAADESGSEFLTGYVKLLIDGINLRSAVRTARMGKDADFLSVALIPGGNIDASRVCAASDSAESLAALYANTVLEKAAVSGAEAISGGRMTAFEKACDNAINEYLKKAKLVAFGPEAVTAFLAAQETEITAVRIMLTGRLAGIAPETIQERLRDLYA